MANRSAFEIVGPEIDQATSIAETARDKTNEFVQKLEDFVEFFDLQQSTVDINEFLTLNPNIIPSTIDIPDAPNSPNFSLNLPSQPSPFVPNSINSINLTPLGLFPTFNIDTPDVDFPDRPSSFSKTFTETAPTVDTFTFPTAPVNVLPTVPTLQTLNLPTLDVINLPSFTQAVPVPDLVIPGQTFAFSETIYSSQLLTDVSTELLSRLSGSTGIDPNVENQIWDRARNRESLNATRSREELDFDNAQTGFSRPSGSMFAAQQRLAQDTQNKIADLSREIAIKQADLEQSNFQNTVGNIISLENILIQNNNVFQQRAFDTAKFVQQVAIDLFNAKAAAFNLEVEGYKLYELEFRSILAAELSKLEVFKGELDSQKLVNEINQSDIALYTAQLQAIQTTINTFKIEVDAVVSQLQGENTKVQNFKALVDAFSSEVGAKRDEFQAYGIAVDAEGKKFDVYDSQVKAFVSRVQAYGSGAEALKTVTDVDIETEKIRLQAHLASLDLFSKDVQSEVAGYQTRTELFRAEAAIFGATLDGKKIEASINKENIDNRISLARAQADISLQNAQINLKNVESANSLTLNAIQSGATVNAQLSASALSGIQLGANLSDQFQNSFSENTNITIA